MKNNDNIRALSDREKARTKLPIFFGSRENYYHGFREVISNAIDEIINNFDKGVINVELKDNIITVMDSGRGLPISKKGDEDLLFTTLFAGGKYDESDKVQTGTNGVGLAVLNFTSKFFKATIYSKDKITSVLYTDGGQNKQMSIEKNNTPIKHGTRIEFELDPECYTYTKFKEEEIEEIIKHFSAVTDNVDFIFNGKKYHYDSIEDYLDENLKNQVIKPYHYEMNFDDGNEKNNYEIVFSASAEPIQETYLNNTYLIENGSIYNGFIKEFTNTVNKLAKEMKLRKTKDSDYSEKDIGNVVSFVVRTESNRVEFAAQTKFSTNKRLYNTQIKQVVKNMIELYANANRQEFKKLVEALNKVHDVNTKANNVQKKLANELKKKVTINNKVEGLVDCKDSKNNELYIVEGRSALGSIVQARDPKTQAVFPLRGKVLNSWGVSTSKLLENKELSNLIKAIGVGVKNTHSKQNDVEIDKARYQKIIIATDADEDGFAIASSLIAFFKKFIPEIIDNNMLYILQTPLYVAHTDKDEYYYSYSESEKNKVFSKIKDRYTISRLKGLGEASPDEMFRFGMNVNTRVLKLIEDDEESVKSLENWFGKDTNVRKKMIIKEEL